MFGSTLQESLDSLQAEPTRINKLPLTVAVLKEILRLHPSGFTIRQGKPGSKINFEGREYPTDGHTIAVLSMAMQRDRAVWGDTVDDFEPGKQLLYITRSPCFKGVRVFETRLCKASEVQENLIDHISMLLLSPPGTKISFNKSRIDANKGRRSIPRS